jgi:hypothetical protein
LKASGRGRRRSYGPFAYFFIGQAALQIDPASQQEICASAHQLLRWLAGESEMLLIILILLILAFGYGGYRVGPGWGYYGGGGISLILAIVVILLLLHVI